MALMAAVQRILDEVHEASGVPVNVLTDPGLRVPAKVTMARGGMPAHSIAVNPRNPLADYYVAFEAAFILRIYATEPEKRFLLGESGKGLRELTAGPLPPTLGALPAAALSQFIASIHSGLLTQLRSQPVGLRVAEWIRKGYPELAEVQAQSIAAEQNSAAQALSAQMRASVPAKVYRASLSMNAAVALASDRMLGHRLYEVPYGAAGHLEEGRALLGIADDAPEDPDHDRGLVDAWAAHLGLSDWVAWVPFEGVKARA